MLRREVYNARVSSRKKINNRYERWRIDFEEKEFDLMEEVKKLKQLEKKSV